MISFEFIPQWSPPAGAFYFFPDVSGYAGARTPSGGVIESDGDLAMHLLRDAGVCVLPGAACVARTPRAGAFAHLRPLLHACVRYGVQWRIRLSFSAPTPSEIGAGVAALCASLRRLTLA